MREELRQLVLSYTPVSDYTTEQLIDCLFEPVPVYVNECDPNKHLYLYRESRDLQMGTKFYNFRSEVRAELKRRTK